MLTTVARDVAYSHGGYGNALSATVESLRPAVRYFSVNDVPVWKLTTVVLESPDVSDLSEPASATNADVVRHMLDRTERYAQVTISQGRKLFKDPGRMDLLSCSHCTPTAVPGTLPLMRVKCIDTPCKLPSGRGAKPAACRPELHPPHTHVLDQAKNAVQEFPGNCVNNVRAYARHQIIRFLRALESAYVTPALPASRREFVLALKHFVPRLSGVGRLLARTCKSLALAFARKPLTGLVCAQKNAYTALSLATARMNATINAPFTSGAKNGAGSGAAAWMQGSSWWRHEPEPLSLLEHVMSFLLRPRRVAKYAVALTQGVVGACFMAALRYALNSIAKEGAPYSGKLEVARYGGDENMQSSADDEINNENNNAETETETDASANEPAGGLRARGFGKPQFAHMPLHMPAPVRGLLNCLPHSSHAALSLAQSRSLLMRQNAASIVTTDGSETKDAPKLLLAGMYMDADTDIEGDEPKRSTEPAPTQEPTRTQEPARTSASEHASEHAPDAQPDTEPANESEPSEAPAVKVPRDALRLAILQTLMLFKEHDDYQRIDDNEDVSSTGASIAASSGLLLYTKVVKMNKIRETQMRFIGSLDERLQRYDSVYEQLKKQEQQWLGEHRIESMGFLRVHIFQEEKHVKLKREAAEARTASQRCARAINHLTMHYGTQHMAKMRARPYLSRVPDMLHELLRSAEFGNNAYTLGILRMMESDMKESTAISREYKAKIMPLVKERVAALHKYQKIMNEVSRTAKSAPSAPAPAPARSS